MQRKIISALILFFAFLSLTLISQEPTKKQLKQREHNVVVDTTVVSERVPDTLLLEQKELNMKLDSLYREKSKK